MKINKNQSLELYYFCAVGILVLGFFVSRWFLIILLIPIGIYGVRIYRKRRYGNDDCCLCERNKCKKDFSPEVFSFANGKPICLACVSRAKRLQGTRDENQKGFDRLGKMLMGLHSSIKERLGPRNEDSHQ